MPFNREMCFRDFSSLYISTEVQPNIAPTIAECRLSPLWHVVVVVVVVAAVVVPGNWQTHIIPAERQRERGA